MKKVSLLAVLVLALTGFAFKASAQTGFPGKWDVLLKGTPQGDIHMMVTLKDSVSTLKGSYEDFASKANTPFTKVEKKDDSVSLFFTAQGYDLTLVLKQADDDHLEGSLMSMFEATAVRVKQ
ncbi:hypothetical protein [Mucilaginibacter pedocola]|uniref:DUF4488 domain-containing protein n=1 Tax=Mucilaginibacter pedocola TaxID=1792845 RepID=A0A1S9PAI3_9SPHI|nr:hypothetical protein [Mucilaginibacter pedocola]OOQ57994.1 hypothetical protein BC343_10020 [Mucilaginibacter pedocola]